MGGYTKSENGNKAYSRSQAESTEIDDGIGGGSGDSGATLKKGPWTASEDAILVEYVKKHGEGNWNAVQKHSGLYRCGKSCRLRWANHLRPNLKKGPFTQEEERLIIELHARMGNKWARMAAHLPGRTDNEIKNYWNTRVKRLQRVGLPLYPPDVCSEAVQESQQGNESGGMDTGGKRCFDSLQTKNYEIPDVAFNDYIPKFAGVAPSCMEVKSFDVPPNLGLMLPTLHRQKRLRQFTALPGYTSSGNYGFSSFGHFKEDSNDIFARHYNFSSSPGPDPAHNISLSCGAMQGSQSLSTGNSSASQSTFVAVKSELPSLQYSETDMGGWPRSSPPPPLFDSIDTFIQTPPEIGTFEPESLSPRNSGLLDALVYEGKALRAGKNNSSDKSTDSSAVTPREICDSSNMNVCESEIEDHGDPVSPFGQSATSLLNDHTPVSASGSSLDEQLPAKKFTGCTVKSEPEPDNGWTEYQAKGTTSQLSITRPDVLLASDWLEQTSEYVREQSLMSDPLATLLDGDFDGDLSGLQLIFME